MKAIYALLLTFTALLSHAQLRVADELMAQVKDGVQFTKVSPLTSSTSSFDEVVNQVVTQAELATINREELRKVMQAKPSHVELSLPYQGESVVVQLFRVNPLAESFHLDTDKATNVPVTTGLYYRGIIKGEMTSLASVNFFDDQFNAIVSSYRLSNFVVAPLDKPGNTTDYILYEDQNLLIQNESGCEVLEDNSALEVFDPVMARQVAESVGANNKCVKMYLEVDHDIYVNKGANVQQATNWVTGLFNHVQTLYANDNINVSLSSVFIWTSVDPYNGNTSTVNLQRFRNNRSYFNGDLGQLIGVDAGNLGGMASGINMLCSGNNYAYSDINYSYSSVPTYSWTISVVTHEFGHLLGSPHTHACSWNGNNTAIDNCGSVAIPTGEGSSCKTTPATLPSSTQKGSIMSYCHLVSAVGINFNNGFGAQPSTRMLQVINNSNCLSTSCEISCINAVNNVRQTFSDATSMTIEWDDASNNTSYEVWVAPYSANADWISTSSQSITVNNLLPNTYYRVRIRPACGDLSTFYREFVFATAADWCQNTYVLTDTGGANINYFNNEDIVRTFYPGEGTIVRIQFTQFNLENNMDFLYIYDGDSVNAPLIGQYTGTTLPPTVIPYNLLGAITFRFKSDSVTTRAGYQANIFCEEKLAAADYETLQFSYYPNPAKDVVNIRAASLLQNVSIYNVTGQLVKQQTIDEMQAQISIAEFASGTYFFVLEGEEGKGNFKIVKI